MSRNEGFFRVTASNVDRASECGAAALATYLVIASGSGRGNTTTKWSAHSVEKRAGIGFLRAQSAVKLLCDTGIIAELPTSTRRKPHYHLTNAVAGTPQEEDIWLPCSVIDGADGEVAPLRRLRQCQDVLLLRLYIKLYQAQSLIGEGGIPREIIRGIFRKQIYAKYSTTNFLGFSDEELVIEADHPLLSAHSGTCGASGFRSGEDRLRTIMEMGLLEKSVQIFDVVGPDGEILFPVDGPREWEKTVSKQGWESAMKCFTSQWFRSRDYSYLIPVFRHLQNAELYSVYRLRHLAHTKLTAAWIATNRQRTEEWKRSNIDMESSRSKIGLDVIGD